MLRDALAAFQPGEIGFIANPYPAYDELRRAGRIHYDDHPRPEVAPRSGVTDSQPRCAWGTTDPLSSPTTTSSGASRSTIPGASSSC